MSRVSRYRVALAVAVILMVSVVASHADPRFDKAGQLLRPEGYGCDRSPARSWRMNEPLSIAGHERTQGWKIWLPGVKVGFQP